MARKLCAPISDSVSHLCHLLFPAPGLWAEEPAHSLIPSMDATLSCTRADIQSQPQHKPYPPLGSVSGKLLPTCQLTAICVFFSFISSIQFVLLSLCVASSNRSPLPLLLLPTPPSGLSTSGSMREAGKRPGEQWTQLSWDGGSCTNHRSGPHRLSSHLMLTTAMGKSLKEFDAITNVKPWLIPGYNSESILVWVSLQSRAYDKDLGTGRLFGRWSQKAGRKEQEEWDGEGREASKWDVIVLVFTLDNWDLILLGDPLRNHTEHTSELSSLRMGIWSTDYHWHLFNHCLSLSLGCSLLGTSRARAGWTLVASGSALRQTKGRDEQALVLGCWQCAWEANTSAAAEIREGPRGGGMGSTENLP